eukprot:10860825-Prorocentrum_lima.AAC.1
MAPSKWPSSSSTITRAFLTASKKHAGENAGPYPTRDIRMSTSRVQGCAALTPWWVQGQTRPTQ